MRYFKSIKIKLILFLITVNLNLSYLHSQELWYDKPSLAGEKGLLRYRDRDVLLDLNEGESQTVVITGAL